MWNRNAKRRQQWNWAKWSLVALAWIMAASLAVVGAEWWQWGTALNAGCIFLVSDWS